ncbi:MAG: hypothetical protein ABEK36_02380 [Candidatus Aenigmatarchaeota archaeon]
MDWVLMADFVIFLFGFYYMLRALQDDDRLDIFLAYSSVLLGIFFAILGSLYGTNFFTRYYSLFMEHMFGVLGAGSIFMFSCFLARKRIKKVLE